MGEFLQALRQHAFLQHALLTGLLVSVACGVVGSYVVTRRITYLAGGIAHCVLGGMGAARYFQVTREWHWLHPLYGALAAALLAAVIIGLVTLWARQREDTVVGALWAVGMAVGVLFISQTPGYQSELMSYLFGDILLVTANELWMLAALDIVVIGVGLLFYRQFLAVCFDEEFARLRGLRVEFYYLLLLCLTAVTVVLLITVVGIVMVIALLTLPAAIAGNFSRTLLRMMVWAVVLSAAFTTAGLALSYTPEVPAGATTILLAGAAYLLTSAVVGLRSGRAEFPSRASASETR